MRFGLEGEVRFASGLPWGWFEGVGGAVTDKEWVRTRYTEGPRAMMRKIMLEAR